VKTFLTARLEGVVDGTAEVIAAQTNLDKATAAVKFAAMTASAYNGAVNVPDPVPDGTTVESMVQAHCDGATDASRNYPAAGALEDNIIQAVSEAGLQAALPAYIAGQNVWALDQHRANLMRIFPATTGYHGNFKGYCGVIFVHSLHAYGTAGSLLNAVPAHLPFASDQIVEKCKDVANKDQVKVAVKAIDQLKVTAQAALKRVKATKRHAHLHQDGKIWIWVVRILIFSEFLKNQGKFFRKELNLSISPQCVSFF
jgi:hypothetical protein